MAKLIAKFIATPTSPLIVECRDGEKYSYLISEGEYEIRLNLPIMEGSPESGRVGSDLYKKLVEKVEIIVTKEVDNIPEIPINENGGRDLYKVSSFFASVKDGYSEIAKKYYRRLIRFMKYDLKQPFQDEKSLNEDQFSNPSWSDDQGNIFGAISCIHHVQPIAGMDGRTIGTETLKTTNTELLQKSLGEEKDIELYQEILSDAQAAIFSGNIRRAVFEMAIVCELSTKRKYFSEGGVSGLAFDYFEDKGKIKVTVLDLISSVGEEALGESFKDKSPDDFKNIDYLFRCRNKVAHRGKTLFKDASGVVTKPDIKIVGNWYESVEALLQWLSSK